MREDIWQLQDRRGAPDLALVAHMPQSQTVEPGGVPDIGTESQGAL